MIITTTTIELTPEDLRQMLDIITPRNTPLPHQEIAPAKLMESARKLDTAIGEARPMAEMPFPSESTADKSKAVEKKQVKTPICTDTWKAEELNLLRTCPTDKDAAFVYASHFRDARSENAVRQRWHKLSNAGQILHTGDQVQIIGGLICLGKIGNVAKFTDDHQRANITFFGNPATYQILVNDLKKVERE